MILIDYSNHDLDEGEESAGFWEALEFRDEGEDDERLDDDDFPLSSALECLQLYRVFPKMAPELESHIVATGKIKKELLVTDGIYILDAGTELSLWIGKKSWNELRDAATTFLRVCLNKGYAFNLPNSFNLGGCCKQNTTKLDISKQVCRGSRARVF